MQYLQVEVPCSSVETDPSTKQLLRLIHTASRPAFETAVPPGMEAGATDFGVQLTAGGVGTVTRVG